MMIESFKLGTSLHNPIFWKKAQMLIAMIATFLPLLAVYIPSIQDLIEKDVMTKLGAGLGGVVIYLTVATTDKIGIGSSDK